MICGVYRLCSDGKEAEVQERLQRLPKSSINQCTKAASDEESVCNNTFTVYIPFLSH